MNSTHKHISYNIRLILWKYIQMLLNWFQYEKLKYLLLLEDGNFKRALLYVSRILITSIPTRNSEWNFWVRILWIYSNNLIWKSVICEYTKFYLRSQKEKQWKMIAIKFFTRKCVLEVVKSCGNWDIEFWGWNKKWIFRITCSTKCSQLLMSITVWNQRCW